MRKRTLSLSNSDSYFLFGARGTGKSTLIHSEITVDEGRVLWIDLLKSQEEQRYFDKPDLLSAQIDKEREDLNWVVIDEVQKVPKLLDVVHHEIEKTRRVGGSLRFALSGSSARKLKRSGANLLAGRAIVHHLFPFTHQELGEDFNLDQAVHSGTLPCILYHQDPRTQQAALEAYVETYLKEEIVAEQLVRNVQPFRKFLNLCAKENGNIVNFHRIAEDLRIDGKTVKTYYDILEDTLLGFYLPAYDKSLRKQQLKSPKFYLFDCGVKRTLDPNLPESGPLSAQEFGLAFEHFILCEFFRIRSYQKRKMFFYHFNTGGSEIDLVIEAPRMQTTFIEIKATEKVAEFHIKALKRLRSAFPNYRYVCISQDPIARIEDGVEITPWQNAFKSIFSIP